jgi:hypothetical protein
MQMLFSKQLGYDYVVLVRLNAPPVWQVASATAWKWIAVSLTSLPKTLIVRYRPINPDRRPASLTRNGLLVPEGRSFLAEFLEFFAY